jgi:hypothetical protein
MVFWLFDVDVLVISWIDFFHRKVARFSPKVGFLGAKIVRI